jgi:hypothetical protein
MGVTWSLGFARLGRYSGSGLASISLDLFDEQRDEARGYSDYPSPNG